MEYAMGMMYFENLRNSLDASPETKTILREKDVGDRKKWSQPRTAESFEKLATFNQEVKMTRTFKKKGLGYYNSTFTFIIFALIVGTILAVFQEFVAKICLENLGA